MRHTIGTLLLAGLAVSCGGGGGSSSSSALVPSSPAPPPAPPPPSPPAPPAPTPTPPPPPPTSRTGPTAVERVFPGIAVDRGTFLGHAGDGSRRLFLCEQAGLVRALAPVADPSKDTPASSTFLDIRSRTRFGGEEGLLSIAFDPGFAQNGRFYVAYSTGDVYDPMAQNPVRLRVSRFTVANGVGDPTSEVVVLEVTKLASNHNGGQLAFGPDGFLYVSLGDGGGGGDPERSGQDLSVLKGKILRIDVRSLPYAVPSDNPFVSQPGARGEIWAYGLRNPWRFSFDRATGRLWAADVGQNQWEEVDLITKGGNYGWSGFEGSHGFNGSVIVSGALPPLIEYDHATGSSITGGYVYRGTRLPALQGAYLYSDFASGHIWAATYDGTKLTGNTMIVSSSGLGVSSFGEDEAGEVYIVSYKQNAIFRLR